MGAKLRPAQAEEFSQPLGGARKPKARGEFFAESGESGKGRGGSDVTHLVVSSQTRFSPVVFFEGNSL